MAFVQAQFHISSMSTTVSIWRFSRIFAVAMSLSRFFWLNWRSYAFRRRASAQGKPAHPFGCNSCQIQRSIRNSRPCAAHALVKDHYIVRSRCPGVAGVHAVYTCVCVEGGALEAFMGRRRRMQAGVLRLKESEYLSITYCFVNSRNGINNATIQSLTIIKDPESRLKMFNLRHPFRST